MFRIPMREREEGRVKIEDLDSNTCEEFLHFLYKGTVKGDLGLIATKLLYAASKYDVQELRNICVKELSTQIKSNVGDASEILQVALVSTYFLSTIYNF